MTLHNLNCPKEGISLYLYISVTDNHVSYVLAQALDGVERLVDFVIKVFMGNELRYQSMEMW